MHPHIDKVQLATWKLIQKLGLFLDSLMWWHIVLCNNSEWIVLSNASYGAILINVGYGTVSFSMSGLFFGLQCYELPR